MYASHRDACVLSYYAHELNQRLDNFYKTHGIDDNVIAYRALGKGNYDFSAETYSYATANAPVFILAIDVRGFYDNLDHSFLKNRLKRILEVTSLLDDWYKVFRFATKFHYVQKEDLEANPTFAARFITKGNDPIATVAELKANNILFHENKNHHAGIPQGTPISATLSNLYMIDFDIAVRTYCDTIGAFYRRYSDDILIICKPEFANNVETVISNLIKLERLELSDDKTERTNFNVGSSSTPTNRTAQYLGFSFHKNGVTIRSTSLSKQWRKMRRAFKRTEKVASASIAKGKSSKIFTKKLRKKFTPLSRP